MSIIEQAARRLEELRRSGVEIPARPAPFVRKTEPTPAGASAPIALHPEAATPIAPHVARARAAVEEIARPTGGSHSKTVDIDLARLAATGYLTPETPRSQLADEFRIIKRPLLLNVDGKSAAPVARANLVMVTSSLPGEGKTFVALNLAMSMAMELDKTVLLVDADVSRPSVLSRLGLAPARGLLDVISDTRVPLSDVILRTNVDGLSLLPAGAPRDKATELLASDAMQRLLDDIAGRYADRIILFDAPPLLPSTESRVLATHMGQVIVVVESERTPQKSVLQAIATIDACPVVMPLLNKADHSEVGSYYDYYGPES